MRNFLYLLAVLLLFPGFICCSGKDETSEGNDGNDSKVSQSLISLNDLITDTVKTKWDSSLTMPDKGSIKLKLNYPGGTLRELFNDTNEMHYFAGEQLGIEPLYGDSILWPSTPTLEQVKSNELYYIDKLEHSYPLLVPESKVLLEEIGRRFNDALATRGGGPYRIKVTSMLRTHDTVSKLRDVNSSSVDSSAHLFGTTFDLSWSKFAYDGGEPHRTAEDLKNLLAEILYGLRNEGRCYVLYEKGGCYHITARPQQQSAEGQN